MQPQSIPENRKFSPYFVFYSVISMQIGVGALGFQRIIAMIAGYDSWQSVIIAGVASLLVMSFMYKQLETVNGDLTDVHQFVFGKWLGKILSIFFVLYFSILSITVLRSYIEVIQVWMFPDLSTFWFSLLYLLLCIYIIFGGIRTVIGISFFSFVLPMYIIYVLGAAIPFGDFRHFLPLFNHSFNKLLEASQSMSLTYMGFETLMIYYPFIKEPKKSKKWAHLGLCYSLLFYFYMTIICFAFYGEEQLQKDIWATLTTFKIVHFLVVERFEYIGIANWCLVILPNICLSLWCATRLLKRTMKIKQKYGVWILSGIILICCPLFNNRLQINLLNAITGNTGFILNFIYIPILFLLASIVKKVKKKA
ncbi:spore gernimation protein GerB [Heyndrickxia shackletonii]|uniref:Spore gernimation protein GerB n=1 Tax=Heyndrickxia shackletonii TaxID=157838 RepID=A0A0Q3TGI9_9BACI|nr:GerAB/ArcD/ProY family transporter [Heyndrickxia shackletonii]KQL53160.1 spore gernimation protein GerB [Heyndrickxia shackletonii]NEZ00655.1 GerAB/ArcD/ProY family transporter [Heyndrickxia shackletonii]